MKKRLTVWVILMGYILITLFSPFSAFAEAGVEPMEEDPAPVAEEERDYDEIGEPANTEFEEEWNLMQTDEEAFRELMEEKGYVHLTEQEKQQMAESDPYGTAIDAGQIPDIHYIRKL